MPFTLVGYSEAQPAGLVLDPLTALPDPHIRAVGDDITIPALNQVIGIMLIGANATRGQLDCPSLRARALYEVSPINRDAEPLSPPLLILRPENPLVLVPNESLKFRASNDATAAVRQTGLIWLADGPITPVLGDVFTVRVTTTVTLTAFAWTNAALFFPDALPVGRYQVVGARFMSPGLLAFRFVFVGAYWRPGGIGVDAVTDLQHPAFRNGGLGVWGEFDSLAPPTVDFLSISADVNPEGWLDLIKIA